MTDGEHILIAGALLAVGLAASLLAGRARVPSLLVVLGLGMVIGSDITGWIYFDDYELARTIGVIALALILFEGGLSSKLYGDWPVLGASAVLAIFGTLITAVVVGITASTLLDLTALEGLLIGATLSATDGAAVFALVRHSTLSRKLAGTLEGESGLNDPVAVLLVIGIIEAISDPTYGIVDFVGLFVQQMGIGVAVGCIVGFAAAELLQRLRLASTGLYPVASLAVAALAFGIADVLSGSGFIAVYIAGLVLGNAAIPARQVINAFHDGLGWIAQMAMFVTLGLLVFPGQFGQVMAEAVLVALVLIFVARPLAVFATTAFLDYTNRERVVLSWAGLRGAVPVVLATFPVIAGVTQSTEFFSIVFFAVLISTVLQGMTFEWLAERLGVVKLRQ